MNVIRAAVVQDSPIVFKKEATIEKVHSCVIEAGRQGAQLVVMPEAFVSAYPTGLDFGARVGLRTAKGRDDFRRYYESAVDVPGLACDALGPIFFASTSIPNQHRRLWSLQPVLTFSEGKNRDSFWIILNPNSSIPDRQFFLLTSL